MTLICVVMNTQSPNQFIDTVNLFDYAFDNFQVLNVAENDTDYSAETTVDNGNLDNIAPLWSLIKRPSLFCRKQQNFQIPHLLWNITIVIRRLQEASHILMREEM